MKHIVRLALASTLALSAASVSAQTTTYTGYDANTSGGNAALTNPNSTAASAQFQAALSGTSTESFEGFATGASAPLTLNFTGSAGTLTANLTGAGNVASATRAAPTSSGQFATDGSKYYTVSSTNFQITFGSPIAAFGFFATDIESNVSLTFAHANGPSEIFTFANLFPGVNYAGAIVPSGSVNFLGFINTNNPYTSVTFGAVSGGDILAFDQMTIGDVAQVVNPPAGGVPEPATWAMMMLGFGGMGYAMRRRKSAGTRIRFA